MRFKKLSQLPGARRTRAGHHHGSHTPTSPEAILLGKMAHHTKQIHRECTCGVYEWILVDHTLPADLFGVMGHFTL